MTFEGMPAPGFTPVTHEFGAEIPDPDGDGDDDSQGGAEPEGLLAPRVGEVSKS